MMLPILVLSLTLNSSLGASQKQELSEKEVAELKKQRDLADAFMRRATEAALKNLEKAPKDDKDKGVKAKENRDALQKQLAKKRYFDSGTKAEELAEFQRWLKEADKSGVKLTDQALQELIKASVLHQLDDK